jgi:transglutaminase-like putative cysteine protease
VRGVDASHAWAGVYSPGFGWVDFDPTNNRMVGTDHITLAWGRDYADVVPVKGLILGGGHHTLGARVDIRPIT